MGVQTLEEFVNSWSVTTDRQCPVKFFKNSAVAQPTLEEAQACESVFSSTMLLEQGISMHVMMPLEMRLKGTTTKLTSKMFGFSKDSVITASALDKDLHRQLKDPKDQVSTLAQESGGAVFDLNRLKSRKRTLAKKASTMMGKALAELSKPLGCEVC